MRAVDVEITVAKSFVQSLPGSRQEEKGQTQLSSITRPEAMRRDARFPSGTSLWAAVQPSPTGGDSS